MTRQTVMSYVNKGELTCVRLARNSVYFRMVDVEEFIERHLERRSPLDVAS
ncbi:helix-turn-helix domain-containing protein [bacterium]|nr:helix-turn-helix domain-containing protein [bacterium]